MHSQVLHTIHSLHTCTVPFTQTSIKNEKELVFKWICIPFSTMCEYIQNSVNMVEQ